MDPYESNKCNQYHPDCINPGELANPKREKDPSKEDEEFAKWFMGEK